MTPLDATAPRGLWRGVDRWWQVLRYHRPEQLVRRLWNLTVGGWINPSLESHGRRREAVRLRYPLDPPQKFCGREGIDAEALRRGEVRLLNETRRLGWPIDWRAAEGRDTPDLWRFNLHYHDFLASLATRDHSAETRANIHQAVTAWIEQWGDRRDASTRRAALHPYCVSRRLASWARLMACGIASPRMIASFVEQARQLARRPERDLGGNHFWENGRGLAIAGCLIDGAEGERFRHLGLEWLESAIAEQVLSTGEHFERTPMYQQELARGLDELAQWLKPLDPRRVDRFTRVAARMNDFLTGIRHPDGGLPLFGDTTLDDDEPDRSPFVAARTQSGWVGDYYVHGEDDHRVIVDLGNHGPDHLPAHAHADLLGYEMSLFGRRAIVDSGVMDYAGPARQTYRSTAAHNVVSIDGAEIADCWKSFRMGRRGHVIERSAGQSDEGQWVFASHDAFARLGETRMTRWWFFARDGAWFCGWIAEGTGRRPHRFREWIHWHPSISLVWEGEAARIAGLPGAAWWTPCRPVAAAETVGRYSERFSVEAPAPVVTLDAKQEFPACGAWSIARRVPIEALRIACEGMTVQLTWRRGGETRGAGFTLRAEGR